MSRRYVAYLPDEKGEDHLFTIVEDIYEAYDLWLVNRDLWFDPVLTGYEPENIYYGVFIEYEEVKINFGSKYPIGFENKIAQLGTYASLEEAFLAKYDNEDEQSRWDLWVEEL